MVTITDAPFEDISNYIHGTVDIFTNYIYINNDSFEWYYNDGTSQNFELCFDVEAYTGTKTIRIYDGSTPNNYYDKSITTTPEHFRIVSANNTNKVYVDGELVATLNAKNNSSIIIKFEGHIIKNYSFNNIDDSFKKLEGVVRWLGSWFYTKDELGRNSLVEDTGWEQVTLASNNAHNPNNPLRIRRVGRLVEIRGAWLPNANTSSSTTNYVFATIPSQFRPTSEYRSTICHGNGLNRWNLRVMTNGNLEAIRYGSNSNVNIPKGAWMATHITYMV